MVYYGAVRDSLKAFPVVNARLSGTPSSQTTAKFDYPGTTPSVSANGALNGIVWAVEAGGETGESDELPGVLHAYDASNLTKELYNSSQSGPSAKFADNKFITPMIAGGKVFVGTPTGVIVFGSLKGPCAIALQNIDSFLMRFRIAQARIAEFIRESQCEANYSSG